LSFSPDGRHLAAAGVSEWKYWDLAAGREVRAVKAAKDNLVAGSPSFSPGGRYVACPGRVDEPVRVWDRATGEEVLSLDAHLFAFSPDDRYLAAVQWTITGNRVVNAVVVQDLTDGREVFARRWARPLYLEIAFSGDGKYLALSNVTEPFGPLEIWDWRAGQLAFTLEDYLGQDGGFAFSPDGRRLAVAIADGSVQVRDTGTNQPLLALVRPHGLHYPLLEFSPDGRHLVGLAEDNTVSVWDAAPPAPEQFLTRRAAALVARLFEDHPEPAAVVERIKADAFLPESLRKEALAWADRYTPEPDRLAQAVKAVVLKPGADPDACRKALRLARELDRTTPGGEKVLLALAHYRLGNF
jgi:hypothetical protein